MATTWCGAARGASAAVLGPRRTPSGRGRQAAPLIMIAPGRYLGAPDRAVTRPVPALRRAGHTEADVRVSVPGIVPVPAARADVPGIVVPGAATEDARSRGRSGRLAGSNHPARKSAWRSRHVSANDACAIQAWMRASKLFLLIVPDRQRSRIPRSRP